MERLTVEEATSLIMEGYDPQDVVDFLFSSLDESVRLSAAGGAFSGLEYQGRKKKKRGNKKYMYPRGNIGSGIKYCGPGKKYCGMDSNSCGLGESASCPENNLQEYANVRWWEDGTVQGSADADNRAGRLSFLSRRQQARRDAVKKRSKR